jgi:hypothetical protein
MMLCVGPLRATRSSVQGQWFCLRLIYRFPGEGLRHLTGVYQMGDV